MKRRMKMEKLKNPSARKLQSFVSKADLNATTILHYTGNMWGIGALLSAQPAISRIENYKNRVKAGMIVLIPDFGWFAQNDIEVPERVQLLMQQYYPGNLSIAFSVSDPRFDGVSVNGKVAFRVPTDPMLRDFIAFNQEPMVSTSINYANLPAENDLKRIENVFGSWIDLALLPHPQAISANAGASTLVEYVGKSEGATEELRCLREGSIPFYEVKRSFNLPMVMFVCTANICRSPIAEKLFAKMVKEAGMSLAVDSSGLLEGGRMISLSSMQLLMAAGIPEAAEHVSKRINPQMVANSWLVLTMEERQRDFLRENNPESARKILTLNELTGAEGDIKDPYGSEAENYEITYKLIEERLQVLKNMILNNEIKL